MSNDFIAGKTEANTAAQGSLPPSTMALQLLKDGCTLLHPIPHAAFLLSPLLHSERHPLGSSVLNLEHSLEPSGSLIKTSQVPA